MHVLHKKKYKKSLFAAFISFICLFTFASHALAAKSASYDKARDSYHSLIKSHKKKKFRHNWENSINRFLKVTKKKGDPKAADATFMVGELYRMLYTYSNRKNDLKKAIKYYEKVASDYYKNSLADDSLYKTGEVYELKLKDYTKAYLAYRRVTKEFPGGDMVSKASSKLIRLKKYAPKVKKGSAAPKKAHDLILIDDIKYWSEDDSTRIVIYPNKSIDYKHNFLKADKKTKTAPRIYIDLFNTKRNPKISHLVEVKDGILKAIRSDQHDKDIVRVVLDIETIKSYRIFTFENPFRIVIDVSGKDSNNLAKAEKAKKYRPAKDITKKPGTKNGPTLARQLGLGVKRIVIDPGHGGKDPGAIGINKNKEKNVTLSISKKLKRMIEKNLDCKVILTRNRDTTLSLEERTAIAKRTKADIFISIHTNASEKNNAHGVETYYLNYATDEHAMRTAARENATSKRALSDLEGIVKIISYSNVQESRELAQKMQRAIVKSLSKTYKSTKDLGVKQAPFYVLFGSSKPSILIETSFIDHKVEGKLLNDDKYHAALAKAIFSGIAEYINGFEIAKKD